MESPSRPRCASRGCSPGVEARGSLSAEERRLLAQIEALRGQLLATDHPVTFTDYGAGSSTATLSEAEMAEGRPKTLTVADACGASKPRRWALLLFHLVREMRPAVCVELGTCVGISGAYQAAALRLNSGGRLITMEGAAPLAELATANFATLGLDNAQVVPGRFQETLDTVLVENAPVDFVFIDGHHDEQATLRYFEQIRPHLSPGAVLLFDDIAWSPGMARAWDTLATSPHVEVALSLGVVGLCVARG